MVNPCLSNYWANVILIIKNSSLLPPVGGVQAWHDDKVMNPVADVEEGKHWKKKKFYVGSQIGLAVRDEHENMI